MYAECDIVMANLFCLSICHTLVFYQNKCVYRQTLSTVWYGHNSIVFLSATAVTKFQGELPQWGH